MRGHPDEIDGDMAIDNEESEVSRLQRTEDQEDVLLYHVRATPGWMITLADLISLMVVFFVLLFSMSEINRRAYLAAAQSLAEKLNPDANIIDPRPTEELQITRLLIKRAHDLNYLAALMEDKLAQSGLEGIVVHNLDDKVVLSLSADVMFDRGSARFRREAEPVLDAFVRYLATLPNRIDVVGHTDPSPINTRLYPSNWELSLARAVAVAKKLQESGVTREIPVFGLGNSRYLDLFPEIDQNSRDRLAKRVDIVIRDAAGAGGLER